MRTNVGARALVCAIALIAALPAAAAARTQVVYAGGPQKFQNSIGNKYGAEANDFFPGTTTIHVGDTITWKGMSINFHTVDIPTKGGSDLPLIVPTGTNVHGINDFAGNPLWFDSGYVPNVGFNTTLFGPSGGSSETGAGRIDSGLPLSGPKSFSVKFLKPGAYTYFCDVHYDMRGVIVVKAKGKKVETAKQIDKRVGAQVKTDTAIAKKLFKSKVAASMVSLGEAGKQNVEILAMFPATQTVSVGTTVTFSMSKLTGEVHTATFGPQAYLKPLANSFNGPPPFDPRAIFPSSPPGTALVVTPTVHGNGFANAGALSRDPATPNLPPSARFTFTTPGTYNFVCLIHPFMHGTIIVK